MLEHPLRSCPLVRPRAQGQERAQRDAWLETLADRQQRMQRQLVELLAAHVHARRLKPRRLASAAGSVEPTLDDLLEARWSLGVAKAPTQPARPKPEPGRPRPAGAATRAGAAEGSDEEEGGRLEASSQLASGSSSLDAEDDQAGASRGEAGKEPQLQQHSGAEEAGSKGAAHAWNAAGLKIGETEVLMTPSMRQQPQEQGQQQQQQQQQQEQQQEQQAMDVEGVALAAEAGAGDLAQGSDAVEAEDAVATTQEEVAATAEEDAATEEEDAATEGEIAETEEEDAGTEDELEYDDELEVESDDDEALEGVS